jgi:hypothetical protein
VTDDNEALTHATEAFPDDPAVGKEATRALRAAFIRGWDSAKASTKPAQPAYRVLGDASDLGLNPRDLVRSKWGGTGAVVWRVVSVLNAPNPMRNTALLASLTSKRQDTRLLRDLVVVEAV